MMAALYTLLSVVASWIENLGKGIYVVIIGCPFFFCTSLERDSRLLLCPKGSLRHLEAKVILDKGTV